MKEIYSIAREKEITTIELDCWSDNTMPRAFTKKKALLRIEKWFIKSFKESIYLLSFYV